MNKINFKKNDIMLKKIFFLFFVLCFFSCESDDICTEKTITPKLIVCIYDKDKPYERKKVSELLVYGEGHPNNEIVAMGDLDSISLPLKMLDKESSFVMLKDAKIDDKNQLVAGKKDLLKIKYEPKQEFGNKGCGIKVVFENIVIEKIGNEWIENVKVLKKDFKDEKNEIICIYH